MMQGGEGIFPLYEKNERRAKVLEELARLITADEKKFLLGLVPTRGPTVLLEKDEGGWNILKRVRKGSIRRGRSVSREAAEGLLGHRLVRLIGVLDGGVERYEVSVLGTHLALYLRRRRRRERHEPRRV